MQSHAYSQRGYLLAPRFDVKGVLGIESSLESLRSSREGRAEGITLRAENIATVSFYGMSKDSIVAFHGSLHRFRMVLPALGTAFYIREEKGNCTDRQVAVAHG